MKLLCKTILICIGISLGLVTTPLLAETSDEWEFKLAPLFLWGMSIDGTTTIEGTDADLGLDFKDDIFENMEGVFTLHFEAHKGDLLLFAEYQYVNLTPGIDASSGPVSVSADIDFIVQMAEFGAGYAISRSDDVLWEVLGGLRWNDHEIDADVEVTGPLPLPEKIKGGDDWVHPFVGARVSSGFAKDWTLIVRGDVGYGGSDDTAYHVNAVVDYRFNEWGSVFGGYRHMEYDYDGSSYAYDASQRGPMLGAAFYW